MEYKRGDGPTRARAKGSASSCRDQETVQVLLFQQPAPGNLMALSGVIGRVYRRICSSSYTKVEGGTNEESPELPLILTRKKKKKKEKNSIFLDVLCCDPVFDPRDP
jgi:hypothetical protein